MNKGSVIPTVLVVILAVSIMLGSLLQLPFAFARYALERARIASEAYMAESALIMYLANFPQGYLEDFPQVIEQKNGAWLELRSGRYVALAGKQREVNRWPQYADWVEGTKNYQQSLLSKIEHGSVRLSGNRRFFKVEKRMFYRVENGDLTINADGISDVMSFSVDGSVVIQGNFQVDSLWIFAKGGISMLGNVRVKSADIYSAEKINIGGNLKIRGHIFGREGVHFTDRAVAYYPSVILAMGRALSSVTLGGKSKVEGVLAAPNGRIEVSPSAIWDSTDALLPFYLKGDYVAFEEHLLE